MEPQKKIRRQRSSGVWDFFTEVKGQCATCNYCSATLSFKSTITNLKKHLSKSHNQVVLDFNKTDTVNETGEDVDEPQIVSREEANLSQPTTSDYCPESIYNLGSNSRQLTSFFTSTNVTCQKDSTSAQSLSDKTKSSGSHLKSAYGVAEKRYLQSSIKPSLLRPPTISEKKKLNDCLMKLFTQDYQPFSIVEDTGFKNFVKALNPNYVLPERKFISNSLLPMKYSECERFVKEKLKIDNIQGICITTDCWTSIANEGYISVTGHYLDTDFNLISMLFACDNIEGNHTAENLGGKILSILTDYKVERNVSCIITDNANNIVSAVKDHMKVDKIIFSHYGCVAHSLNLILQNALEIDRVASVISSVKKIVTHFKHSVIASEGLINYQKINSPNEIPKKLIQSLPTRWNSTYYMLERFIQLKNAITCTLATSRVELTQLSHADWDFITELLKILKPFEKATRDFSGQKYSTASIVIVVVNGLVDVCDALYRKNFREETKEVILNMRQGLIDRFPNIEQRKTFSYATILDPRFKLDMFNSKETKASQKASFINELTLWMHNTQRGIITTSIEPEQEEEIDEDVDYWAKAKKLASKNQIIETPRSRAIVEFDRYLNEQPLISLKEDPFIWWKNNSSSYKTLAEMARRYLAVSATSVPSERLFSKSGYMISDRRSRLGKGKLNKLLFLNCNEKLMKPNPVLNQKDKK